MHTIIKSGLATVFMFATLMPTLAFSDECVVLLHGLAKTSHSMNKIERHFAKEGYTVINHSYPSRSAKIEKLASREIATALAQCKDANKVHFITHSLGGILLRYYLGESLSGNLSGNTLNTLGHIVMIGPPNKGSQTIDTYGKWNILTFLFGPASMQLSAKENSLVNQLPRIGKKGRIKVGIIAGSKSFNPILSLSLPGIDDGKVTIENTHLEEETDHIVLPTSHVFMTRNKKVIAQAMSFIKNGVFDK